MVIRGAYLMSESIHNCSVAYTKGVRASGKPCPYGDTKRALKHWWECGVADALLKTVDQSMIVQVRI